jgi:hypothetical protein
MSENEDKPDLPPEKKQLMKEPPVKEPTETKKSSKEA